MANVPAGLLLAASRQGQRDSQLNGARVDKGEIIIFITFTKLSIYQMILFSLAIVLQISLVFISDPNRLFSRGTRTKPSFIFKNVIVVVDILVFVPIS